MSLNSPYDLVIAYETRIKKILTLIYEENREPSFDEVNELFIYNLKSEQFKRELRTQFLRFKPKIRKMQIINFLKKKQQ
jgi:hypothetical protein